MKSLDIFTQLPSHFKLKCSDETSLSSTRTQGLPFIELHNIQKLLPSQS